MKDIKIFVKKGKELETLIQTNGWDLTRKQRKGIRNQKSTWGEGKNTKRLGTLEVDTIKER